MKTAADVGLKFSVPRVARAALRDELARGSASERTSLAAMYLDTEDRCLARAGVEWRLRREGRRWIQTLRLGKGGDEASEHEVIRPHAQFDAEAHAGTSLGDRLLHLLHRDSSQNSVVGVRFQTEVRRVTRRIRARGAVVDVTFDEGRLLSDRATQRICDVEFRTVSGSTASMLSLVERWRKRFGLLYEPRSNVERGERLANGVAFAPVRKAARLKYRRGASAVEAFGSVLAECVDQIARNAVGLTDGDPALRVEHVHQLRVGIRRLRSALRSFEGWAPTPALDRTLSAEHAGKQAMARILPYTVVSNVAM